MAAPTPKTASAPSGVPLCVELDESLLCSHSFAESLASLLRKRPALAFLVPFWAVRGRAYLKDRLAELAPVDVSHLPYDSEVVRHAKKASLEGRRLVLVTGANERLARAVAAHLGLFGEVIASTRSENLTGRAKAEALLGRFGERGFDYVGGSRADLATWSAAAQVVLARPSRGLSRAVLSLKPGSAVLSRRRARLPLLFRAIRVHQWSKNALVAAPLLLAMKVGDGPALLDTLVTFFSYCLAASGVYLLNDLLDVDNDRAHPTKRNRPFAAGTLPLGYGFVASPLLFASGLGIASLAGGPVLFSLASYLLMTGAYSFGLKRYLFADVIVLSCLYLNRIVSEALAAGVPISHWFLVFGLFFFLSLALVKRSSELLAIGRGHSRPGRPSGRGYLADDLPPILCFGCASAYLSVFVLAFYLQLSPTLALYRHPQLLWLQLPILTYWVSRLWVLVYRGKVHEDPVVFVFTDKASLVTLVVSGAAWLVAWGPFFG